MLFYLYSALCLFLPCLAIQLLLARQERRIGHTYSRGHWVWTWIFFLYIFLVFQVTGFGTIWEGLYRLRSDGSFFRRDTISLIPFDDVSITDATSVLNIIMTMPLGFLLPLIWPKYNSVLQTLITGACVSLAIEVSQLFNNRATDIDDLILNTLGVLLGWLCWRLIGKFLRKTPDKSGTGFLAKHEAALYLSAGCLGQFFLYNGLGLVQFLYY